MAKRGFFSLRKRSHSTKSEERVFSISVCPHLGQWSRLCKVGFQGVVGVAAVFTSPCSPPLLATDTEILTRGAAEHHVEVGDTLLVGLGDIADVERWISPMHSTVTFCGVLIELAEKGRF